MAKALTIIGVVAVVGLLAFVAFDPANVQRREDAASYARQQQQLDLQREQLRLEQERQRAAVLEPASVVGQLVVSAVLIAALGGLVVMAAHAYWQRRAPLVRADERGQFPVSRQQIEQGALLPLVEQIAVLNQHVAALKAQHQPGQTPASLHYSPSLSYSYEHEQASAPAALALDALAPAVNVPTFAQLLDQGRIGKGNPLLLGVDLDDGKELPGSWLDLYSTLVGGMPGTGKTTTQRFFASQVALHGALFVVVDPHLGAADDSLGATLAPLASCYLQPAASDDKAILRAVRTVASIGEARIKGRDTSTRPVLLWLDEATTLLGHSKIGPELATLLEQIAQQYRKRGVFACCSGQIWTAARSSSELRDSFASAIVHRMKRNQARLLLPTDDAQKVERLEAGQAVLWRTNGASTVVQIPQTTAVDVQRVAGLLTDTAPTITRGAAPSSAPTTAPTTKGGASKPEGAAEGATEGADALPLPGQQNAPNLSPDARRIVQAFLGGQSPNQIASELAGSSGGRAYKQASEQVAEALRAALGAGVRDAA
jgi:hypothetical protein